MELVIPEGHSVFVIPRKDLKENITVICGRDESDLLTKLLNNLVTRIDGYCFEELSLYQAETVMYNGSPDDKGKRITHLVVAKNFEQVNKCIHKNYDKVHPIVWVRSIKCLARELISPPLTELLINEEDL